MTVRHDGDFPTIIFDSFTRAIALVELCSLEGKRELLTRLDTMATAPEERPVTNAFRDYVRASIESDAL